MAEVERAYTIANGSTLEYAEDTGEEVWKRIYGLKKIPPIGEAPNDVDTTCLDNSEYETSTMGLMPAVKLDYEFNLEDPSVEANIYVAHQLKESKKVYKWRITRSNGIVHKYRSKVLYGFSETESGNISSFQMFHRPIGEIQTEINVEG